MCPRRHRQPLPPHTPGTLRRRAQQALLSLDQGNEPPGTLRRGPCCAEEEEEEEVRAAEERQAPSPSSPPHACSGQGGWRGRSARAAAEMACPGSRMSEAVLRSVMNLPGAPHLPPLPPPRFCLRFRLLPRRSSLPVFLPFAFCPPALFVCAGDFLGRIVTAGGVRWLEALGASLAELTGGSCHRSGARQGRWLFALCLVGLPAFWGRGASSWTWGVEGDFPGSLRGNVSCSFIKIQKGACPRLWLAFKTWGRLSPGQGEEKQEQEEQ